MYREEKIVTQNGVNIFYYKNPALHGFYISLYLPAGSMFEDHPGISHFLEHAAIRNVDTLMNGELYSTLDKKGIEFNATTYNELVRFYISGATENFNLSAEIFAKLLSPIVLSPREISLERDRIKAEIREGDDKTSLSTFSGGIVYEGTKLVNLITGTIGSVNKIHARLLEEYRRSVMTKENIFFYVTGNFDEKNLEKLSSEIEKYQLDLGRKNENIAPVCEKFGKREPKVYIKNASFTMLRFSFDVDMNYVSPQEIDLIYDMLFSGYNSLFFIEMSERRGLCYDISGYFEMHKNIGELSFSFEVRGGRLKEAIDVAISLLRDFKSKAPDDESMMKAAYVTNSQLLYDNPSELNFAFAYDNHVMNLGYSDIKERAGRYAAVTPERIREASSHIFLVENMTLALKGNKKKINVQELENIIKTL